MRLAYLPYMLRFRQPAGTSRGVMTEKPTYLLKVYDENNPQHYGLGEASVFPGLSPEADGRYEYKIVELLANIALGVATDLSKYSSLQLGLEEALLNFSQGTDSNIYYPSDFTEGKSSVTINGLVWMGSLEEMKSRAAEKLKDGFTCLKFKVGALDWESEFEMIKQIRKEFKPEELEIRLDANGGFPREQALERLNRLDSLAIHSIEQPIPPGDPDLMAMLCRRSPVAIALDESLIGLHSPGAKRMLLDYISPQYIILKPSLCGGFSGAAEWISLANERNVGWWVTSALESNVGLNAIAQWAATIGNPMPQGLGTGLLYSNNFPSPLYLKGPHLHFNPDAIVDRALLDSAEWRE